jgi:hypothetical protein
MLDTDEAGNEISVPHIWKTAYFRGRDGASYIKEYHADETTEASLYSPERLRGVNLMLYVTRGDDTENKPSPNTGIAGYVDGYTLPGASGALPKDIARNSKGEYWSRGNRCQAGQMAGQTVKTVTTILCVLCTLATLGVGYMFGVSFGSLVSLVCAVVMLIGLIRGRPWLVDHYAKKTGEVGYEPDDTVEKTPAYYVLRGLE